MCSVGLIHMRPIASLHHSCAWACAHLHFPFLLSGSAIFSYDTSSWFAYFQLPLGVCGLLNLIFLHVDAGLVRVPAIRWRDLPWCLFWMRVTMKGFFQWTWMPFWRITITGLQLSLAYQHCPSTLDKQGILRLPSLRHSVNTGCTVGVFTLGQCILSYNG